MKQITEEIILCDKCKGYGYIEEDVRITLRESEFRTYQCNNCKGTGRLIKRIISVIKPYNEKE